MRKGLYAILSLVAFSFMVLSCGTTKTASTTASTDWGKRYVIGFYNLENLFDTFHDEGKNDYQFLPDGSYNWTEAKYQKKLHNMASVIKAMAEDNKSFHAILGVAEVENRHCLEDLVSQPEISAARYQIVHRDSPDSRGIDCAILYRPDLFTLQASEFIPFDFNSQKITFKYTEEEQKNFRTRDIVMARGLMNGEMFAFFVCHFPSRLGGKGHDARNRAAEIVYQRAEKLMEEFPGIKIVVMGDMNDNPSDESMTQFMHCKGDIAEVGSKDFFSPFLPMQKAGYGSLAYQGGWNIYDIIVVNQALTSAPEGKLRIKPIVKDKYYGRIFSAPFMTTQDGQYKGQPFRTFSNNAFAGGYSDHYPTYIIVSTK